MNFVSSSPPISNQTLNTLTWNLDNFLPLETREIELFLDVNAPTDLPPANIGDQLDFEALINPIIADAFNPDNTFGLKQIVEGSFDPNDKTCLQGPTISTEDVGKYVHYVIRFENTGTYAAENIVVKDTIDLAKFNLASLVPLSSSHEFSTNMRSGNIVEFIFENINLPFEDENNDGYVAFKIKTLPGLGVGDSFSNNASIYFDYNFPIITNTATTTIESLGTLGFAFSDYFTLYPNPCKTVMNIKATDGVAITDVTIYNLLGQVVLAFTGLSETTSFDVSSLRSGNYFIKINSDKGITNTNFVKD